MPEPELSIRMDLAAREAPRTPRASVFEAKNANRHRLVGGDTAPDRDSGPTLTGPTGSGSLRQCSGSCPGGVYRRIKHTAATPDAEVVEVQALPPLACRWACRWAPPYLTSQSRGRGARAGAGVALTGWPPNARPRGSSRVLTGPHSPRVVCVGPGEETAPQHEVLPTCMRDKGGCTFDPKRRARIWLSYRVREVI